jgi:hypothetical protein
LTLDFSFPALEEFYNALLIVAFLWFWHIRVTGTLSLMAGVSLLLFVFACLAFGGAFTAAISRVFNSPGGVPFQFLTGFFIFNTCLFLMAILLPFAVTANFAALSVIGVVAYALTTRRRIEVDISDQWAGIAAILVSGAASTLWCGDAQHSLHADGDIVVFQFWKDTFIHAREISVFANSHGLGTIHDIKLAGMPAPIYHFASYLSSAAMSALAGTPAIAVYSSFQLPLGIFLTGLAAYCLISQFFGIWPGVVATVAVTLVPDAYQQGFGNRYLSYFFLSQVNLGMLYGIASVAIGWAFMIEACRRGRLSLLAMAYAWLAVCLLYKAHIFVANSYLMFIFPAIFFIGIARWRRLVLAIFLSAVFAAVIGYSQTLGRVPLLRLDGSGIGAYIVLLLQDYDAGLLKDFFTRVFTVERHAKPIEALYAAGVLTLSTFGVWAAAAAVVTFLGRKKIPLVLLLMPVLVISNYLIMAMGLALDTRGIGTVDELVNRPLVWAFFLVAAWTAGLACHLVFDADAPRRHLKIIAALACVGLALVTSIHARNLQTFPARAGYGSYEQANSVPLCLVKAAEYIRVLSAPGDLLQDSGNDPRFIVTAIAERQLFVGKLAFGGANKLQQDRLDAVRKLQSIDELQLLHEFAAYHQIAWYLLRPDSSPAWPAEFLRQPAFECQGYRVYRFIVP